MSGWGPAPEVAWDRKQRLTQYTPDISWGDVTRPGRSPWSSLRVRALTLLAAVGAGLAMLFAPDAQANNTCRAVNVQGGVWGGTQQSCLPDGSMYICDRGWAPFVGQIENCFWAPIGHPRNPA